MTGGHHILVYHHADLTDPNSQLNADLVTAHQAAYRAVLKRSGSPADAKDACQSAVEGLLGTLFNQQSMTLNLAAYLTTSALRAYEREAKRRPKEYTPPVYLQLFEQLDDTAELPAKLIQLGDALSNLVGNRELICLYLHVVDRYTYREIAALTGWGGWRTIGDWVRSAIRKLNEHRDDLGL